MNREQEYLAKISALETDLKNSQHVMFFSSNSEATFIRRPEWLEEEGG